MSWVNCLFVLLFYLVFGIFLIFIDLEVLFMIILDKKVVLKVVNDVKFISVGKILENNKIVD